MAIASSVRVVSGVRVVMGTGMVGQLVRQTEYQLRQTALTCRDNKYMYKTVAPNREKRHTALGG